MKTSVRILHLEDNSNDAELIRSALEEDQFECDIRRVETGPDFEKALLLEGADLVLSDFALPSFDGIAALRLVRQNFPGLPFILVSGTIGEEAAVETLTNGATDYVLKQNLERLAPAVRRALREAAERAKRAQAEAALRRSEERFRAFMDHSASEAFIKDEEGRYVYANRRLEETISRSWPELADKTDLDIFEGEDARMLQENDRRVFSTRQPARVLESLVIRGQKRHWIVSKFLIPNDSRRLLGGVAVEITERIEKETQIQEQADLLDKAQDAILVKDLEQRITYWNRGAERLYGWTAAEAVGKKGNELLYSTNDPRKETAIRLLSEKGEWIGELTQATKAGKEIVVMCRLSLMRDQQGRPRAILNINTDITEKKQMEVQFLRAQRLESIGTLAGGIAHDLNNILAPILMAVQLLRFHPIGEEEAGLLDTLESSARRGADMVKQILSFARGMEGEKAELQLRHIILDQVKMAADTFPKTIRVETGVARDLWAVIGDSTQIHQVLMNLCVNARDAMPQGGTLRIRAENIEMDEDYARMHLEAKPGPYVSLGVEDTGTGIPPEVMNRIFDPFFTTKELGKGTGLGLSTVLGIVKGHGGFLNVYSEPGKGTSFRIYLPALKNPAAAAAAALQNPAPRGTGELILVVDDEPQIRKITKGALENMGYRALTASDGTEALAIYAVQGREIRLVVTDMAMPFMDGVSTIRALRRMNPAVKIVATSGMPENTRLSDLDLDPASAAFLQKPFAIDKLVSLIHNMLAKENEALLSGEAPPPVDQSQASGN